MGKGMAGTGSRNATVYNKPGVGVRKMEATRWLAALFILIIMYAGIYYYTKSVKAIATLGLPIALVVFVGIIYWIKAMGNKAEACADRALDARRGAVAEEAVGNLPGELPAGYFVVNDFESKRGNIDHIVISTKGILTVATKSQKGVVTCEGEMLKRDGKPFEKDFIKQAWAEAYSIRDLLTEKGVCNLRPQPVIVFTEADVQVKEKVRGVKIIGIKDLHAFLEGLPNWMSERLSNGIINCLSSAQYYYRNREPKPNVVRHNIAIDPSQGEIKFEFSAPEAKEVSLVGNFNQWNSKANPMKKEKKGVWRVTLSLEPGRYEYRFIADGNWENDPSCSCCVTNEFGGENCVRIVA
jgi:hypothetical protein